jgi:nucleoside-diphosphate-sugar epimerase
MTLLVTGAGGFVGRALVRAFVAAGRPVRGMVRTPEAAAAVSALGGQPVVADLRDPRSVGRAMEGVSHLVHAAAKVSDWGDPLDFTEVNVHGTWNVMSAALVHRVSRVVHISTEAVLLDRRPLVQVDEDTPLPVEPIGEYARSKGEAERQVQRAVNQGLDACIVRPRLVWGPGDTSVLPRLITGVRRGTFRWVDGGRFLTSTCHVDNLCEGVAAALDRGRPGGVWFLTDGAPVEQRAWLSDVLKAHGVTPPTGAIPWRAAWAAAGVAEFAWRTLRRQDEPPLTRSMLLLGGREVTVRDDRARADLGYVGRTTHAEALFELQRSLTRATGPR